MTRFCLILGAVIISALAVFGCNRWPTAADLWTVYPDGRLYRFDTASMEHCQAVRAAIAPSVKAVCMGRE